VAPRLTISMIVFKRLCRPLANNRVHHQPDVEHRPRRRLVAAYHRADKTIQSVVDLLAAA
jgi:hypothetical protein